MRLPLASLLLASASIAQAQGPVVPNLELDNPRVQTIAWEPGIEVLLTIMPGSGTTIMLEPGEAIGRVTLTNEFDYSVRISPEGNSLLVLADQAAEAAAMTIETDRRRYPLSLRTGQGLTAAYLLRFTYGATATRATASAAPPAPTESWSYQMRGDREVRPQAIRDDAQRTYITYFPEQALPAVFAIGQTGDEEMVNGYMRDGIYVIGRVYGELVFRLDGEKATARRNSEPDAER